MIGITCLQLGLKVRLLNGHARLLEHLVERLGVVRMDEIRVATHKLLFDKDPREGFVAVAPLNELVTLLRVALSPHVELNLLERDVVLLKKVLGHDAVPAHVLAVNRCHLAV